MQWLFLCLCALVESVNEAAVDIYRLGERSDIVNSHLKSTGAALNSGDFLFSKQFYLDCRITTAWALINVRNPLLWSSSDFLPSSSSHDSSPLPISHRPSYKARRNRATPASAGIHLSVALSPDEFGVRRLLIAAAVRHE